ncbi:MAG TPA: hypothetical protein PL167_14090, partial [Cyclobacteriaceae bacterium]|nr:hypothetical protein [Cyclobacteriaceae bacterium]
MIGVKKTITAFGLYFLGMAFCFAQSPSVLSSGNWFKFSVTADGVVKIDYSLLRNAGVNPDQIDPRNIKIYTSQNGMLPQANNQPRKSDLTEIAIEVSGESDGRFNTNDFILFFGQGPDKYQYNIQKKIFEYQNNLFTDKNFYFLTVGSDAGKRLTQSENLSGTFPLIQQYDDLAFYETDKYNILKSGRHWFGEQFDAITEATIRFDISGVIENSDIKLVSHVMAQSITNSSFQVSINNNPVLTQPIVAIPNTNYGIKGRIQADTITLNATSVAAPGRSSQEVKYQFTKGSPGLSVGYLDFFLLTLNRKIALYGDQTIISSSSSLVNPASTFEVASVAANTRVWDVTDPDNVKEQAFSISSDRLNFSTESQSLRIFVVFNPDKVKAPAIEGKVLNQNLHGITAPDL